jgi:tRNA/tmRNA/rRNA uracil-C5-methylase (TrmA/RlmC/RlmD family)
VRDGERDGEVVEVEVGPVAHGGHCVARLPVAPGEERGRVVFVRHALPGERVRVRLTETGRKASFWRGDAIEVLDASADRVDSLWPQAGPGGIGGGELAHVRLDAQRAWKSAVLGEQLSRLAKVEREVPVHAMPGDAERGGLAWRTRVELEADAEGRAAMRRFRSHTLVPVEQMPLMSDALAELDLLGRRWRAGSRIEAVAPAAGDEPVVLVDGQPYDLRRGKVDPRPNARSVVREEVTVGGTTWQYRVAAAGFWQVHREAPAALTAAVLDALGDVQGATVLDLFSGAGLFTLPIADAVGEDGAVVDVEGDARAVRDARRNAHDRENVELLEGRERGCPGRRRRAGPAAGRCRAGRGALDRRAGRAARGLRGLRPGGAGAGRRVPGRGGLRPGRRAGLRPVPDDPPRRGRRGPHPLSPRSLHAERALSVVGCPVRATGSARSVPGRGFGCGRSVIGLAWSGGRGAPGPGDGRSRR